MMQAFRGPLSKRSVMEFFDSRGECGASFTALYKIIQAADTGNRSVKTFVGGPGRA